MKIVYLKPGREHSLRRFHPWVFSGAIKESAGSLVDGDLVEVFSADNQFLGTGYFCADASIAVKMLSFVRGEIDRQFWIERVAKALELRKSLGLGREKSTNCYRLLNAEGDQLPGLIVDIYDKVAVVQCQTKGIHLLLADVTAALLAVLKDEISAIFDKSSDIFLEGQQSISQNRYVFGGADCPTEVWENGLRFLVDWEKGQKTGFFIDQRLNRQLVRSHSGGRHVLNAFCYTGGFSVYALSGGAKSVESVDSSKTALQLLEKNVALNFDDRRHRTVTADYFDYIQDSRDKFDLIILDPPAFAKHKSALKRATQGYRSINFQAISQIQGGGLLFTFSCSQLLSRDDFRTLIQEAAIQTKRSVKIIHELHQTPCHPVNVFHPEGEYLKGFVLVVD